MIAIKILFYTLSIFILFACLVIVILGAITIIEYELDELGIDWHLKDAIRNGRRHDRK